MPKKIIYYVQRYRPKYEAISKEVSLLANHFRESHFVKLHDLHLDGLTKIKFNQKISSYHFLYYPFLLFYIKFLSYGNKINHIYTSLGDLPYLNVLSLKNTVLTAAASSSFNKILRRKKKLEQLNRIVVETNKQKNDLIKAGISGEKIQLVYPSVDLDKFFYQKAQGVFKLLYASCPIRRSDFKKRGIYLLLRSAKSIRDVYFIFAWRKGAYQEINSLVNIMNLKNVKIENEIVKDMNQRYAEIHATVIPYTRFHDYLKLIPNSVIESLAAGKPVIVSNKTEVAGIVKKYKCGVVFEPTVEHFQEALKDLKKNYQDYQKNCRRVAEKYFSKDVFLNSYEKIYAEMRF
ncbi:MAG TPA: glycosyltransferase [Candidatus Nanoarchaeia archaeon]|nr:glycosyltransferase [Candidatus Nanoarchaeia archaeon]